MVEAYSMINQKLRESDDEHAYLENSSQELKVSEWGTTNIAVICDDAIFIGADTRATGNGFIMYEKANKFVRINDYNILAAMAGNSSQCKETLKAVKETMEDPKYVEKNMGGPMEIDGASDLGIYHEETMNDPIEMDSTLDIGIHHAATIAQTYINAQSYSFDASALIVGWKEKNESFDPFIYLVGKSSNVIKESARHKVVVNGSGGYFAQAYYEKYYNEGSSKREIFDLVKRALLYAALQDMSTGGILRVVEVRSLGYDEKYYQPVLEVFYNHYNHLVDVLSKSFFSLSYNYDHHCEYTPQFNERIHREFQSWLPGYSHNVVIRLNGKFIVRLLHFTCSVNNAYDFVERNHESSLRTGSQPRHLLDPNVPRQVKALPWFIIPTLSQSPIMFGKHTQELVGVLRDV